MTNSMRWAWAVAVVVVSVVLVLALVGPEWVSVGTREVRLWRDDFELRVFHQRGGWVTDGVTPYNPARFQEYPQLGLAYLTVPYLGGGSYESYRAIFMVMNYLCLVALIGVTILLLRRFGKSPWSALLLVLPAMLYFSVSRFDIFVALIVQLSLYCLLTKRFRRAFVLLAAGILTKWYPILVVPIYLLYLRRTLPIETFVPQRRQLLIWIAGIVGGVLVLSFAIDGFSSLKPYLFHSSRSAGVGSLFFLLFENVLRANPVSALTNLGLAVFFLLQFALPLLVLCLPTVWRPAVRDDRSTIALVALAVGLFMFFSRFASPQWIVWLMPLLLLLVRRPGELIVLALFDLVTFISFPIVWNIWGPHSVAYTAVSAALVLLLAGLCIWLARLLPAERKAAAVL